MKNKKTRRLKAIGFSSLALLMGIAGTLAFAPLSNAPVMPSSLSAGATAEGQNLDLGLRPDTDPVVYTTESGLEIKKSNGKYSSTTTVTTNAGYTYTQDLTGFYYFTMGKFSGTIYSGVNGDLNATYAVSNEPVNWLIIGRGPGFNFEKSTPAGTSLENDKDKQEIATSALILPNFFTTVPEHSDIPEGCILVISEKLLGQSSFNSSGNLQHIMISGDLITYYFSVNGGVYGNRYRYKGDISTSTKGTQTWNNKTAGSLYTYINNLFSKNNSTGAITGSNKLGFTQAQSDMIVPQQLYTFYSNGEGYPRAETPSTDGGTYYTMFPLALKSTSPGTYQNFCLEDFLITASQRFSTLIKSNTPHYWWIRSGDSNSSHLLAPRPNAAISQSNTNLYHGVRPAMVMRLA